MNRPRVNEVGEIDLESVNALSRTDLGEWIQDRLKGRDLFVPSDPRDGQMPHYLLSLLYPKLSRQVREDFQSIVVGFVRDLLRHRDPSWHEEAADELFMLLNSLLPSLSNKATALDLLLEIVEGGSFPANARPDLRFRALQGIITLRHRTDADFWLRQLREGGERYYSVFLEGLSLVGISVLFESIEKIKWTQHLSDALLAILPNLLEEYGAGKVAMAIEENLSRLSPEARKTMIELLEDEELAPMGKFVSTSHSRVRPKPRESSYDWVDKTVVLGNLAARSIPEEVKTEVVAEVIPSSLPASLPGSGAQIQPFPLFANLSPAEFEEVTSAAHEKVLPRRKRIFIEGDPIREVHLLISGWVKVTQLGPHGQEVILRLVGPGELIGAPDLSVGKHHLTTAQAIEPSTALVWKASVFESISDRISSLRRNMVRILGERLQEMDARFREMSTQRVGFRLSHELIRMMNQLGRRTDQRVEIRLSREELAQLTGTTLFTVSRLLSQWEQQGILKSSREKVVVYDLQGLKNVTDEL